MSRLIVFILLCWTTVTLRAQAIEQETDSILFKFDGEFDWHGDELQHADTLNAHVRRERYMQYKALKLLKQMKEVIREDPDFYQKDY